MTSYNVHQQVFGLSLASNAVHAMDGTQAELQATLQKLLPGLLAIVGAGWEVVWGPVVWKNNPTDSTSGPDNAWYVARNPAVMFEDGSVYETYVVAIAGTASASYYDLPFEDIRVNTVVNFSEWISTGLNKPPVATKGTLPGTYIAFGTATGVFTLLSQPAPAGAAGAGLVLWDFMSILAPSSRPAKVIFTGHSLGGALSPTLALAFLNAGVLRNFPPSDILTYPTAGPSPGDANFAQLFAQRFPKTAGSGYQLWNCNIVNSIDIVPQAWCGDPILSPMQNLSNIPSIYGLPRIERVSEVALIMILLASESLIIYIPLQSSIFMGTPPQTTPSTPSEFGAEAIQQHTTGYYNYFNVFPPPGQIELDKILSKKTDKELYLTYPIIGHIVRGDARRVEGEAANDKAGGSVVADDA